MAQLKNRLLTFKQWLTKKPLEIQILVYASAISLVPTIAMGFSSHHATETQTHQGAADIATMIPKGFVLVPIEIQNYEAVDSILGHFAIVDLFFSGGSEAGRQKLVAKNVRLLRAPQNPSHFAVLVQEAKVDQILKYGSLLTVVIKHGTKNGTEFVNEPQHREILYEGK